MLVDQNSQGGNPHNNYMKGMNGHPDLITNFIVNISRPRDGD